jgi:hypothetical protein
MAGETRFPQINASLRRDIHDRAKAGNRSTIDYSVSNLRFLLFKEICLCGLCGLAVKFSVFVSSAFCRGSLFFHEVNRRPQAKTVRDYCRDQSVC